MKVLNSHQRPGSTLKKSNSSLSPDFSASYKKKPVLKTTNLISNKKSSGTNLTIKGNKQED
jgi:hypothetical protein